MTATAFFADPEVRAAIFTLSIILLALAAIPPAEAWDRRSKARRARRIDAERARRMAARNESAR